MIELGSYCCSLGRKTLALVEYKSFLRRCLMLLRLWDRRDEFGAASVLDDLLRGLASLIELPVAPRVFVGGVQDWVIKEGVVHEPASGMEAPLGRSRRWPVVHKEVDARPSTHSRALS
jgi:hypothetical protein